jgi:methylthioribulose-1-phosphate dehydratase
MIDRKTFYQQATALAAAGDALYQRGWVPATSGNFSMRLSENTATVTASGKHKGRLAPTDFIAVDLSGNTLTDGKPSAETELHTQLYARFTGIGAVLHCHSPKATVLSMLMGESTELIFEGYELQKAFAGINSHDSRVTTPIFENSQDIHALALEVDQYLIAHPDCPGYLIRGHGIYCWADSLDNCMHRLEALDFLLSCELEMRRHH